MFLAQQIKYRYQWFKSNEIKFEADELTPSEPGQASPVNESETELQQCQRERQVLRRMTKFNNHKRK